MAGTRPTQKQVAGKYTGNLEYFTKPHYLRRLRGWVFVVAVVGSISGAITFRYWGKQEAFSIGPISENHARFARDCRVCHLDAETDVARSLMAAKRQAPALATVHETMPKVLAPASRTLMDQACLQCHPTKGLHLPQAVGLALRTISSEINVVHASGCAVCHREHMSAERMAPPDRQTCAACHNSADELKRTRRSIRLDNEGVPATGDNRDLGDGLVRFLAPALPVGALKPFATYAAGHPPFGYEQPKVHDPAQLKFNHARHLRDNFPQVKNHKLDCADCHQPGAGGAFYQPVSYEKHCQQCHSLQIQPSLPKLLIPHGDPEKVRYFLASLEISFKYAIRADGVSDPDEISRRVELEKQSLRRRQLSSLGDLEERVFFQGDPRDDKDDRLMRAGHPKFLTECAKCHTVTPGSAEHAPNVQPPNIAERWVQRGPFTHLPHEHMVCRDCHGAADTSKLTSDILLPPQKLCAECHRPPNTSIEPGWDSVKADAVRAPDSHALAAAQRSAGGVKWDCQGCHIFHAPPDATALTQAMSGAATARANVSGVPDRSNPTDAKRTKEK